MSALPAFSAADIKEQIMVKLTKHGVFLNEKCEVYCPSGTGGTPENPQYTDSAVAEGRRRSMAYQILQQHNHSGDPENLKLRFDAMVSPDNNYVNILQTARASGLKEFPVPYVLSNCHNTLCAVGGTILEDDHAFGLSNARRYGGIFLPPYRGVLHQYMREMMAGAGKMILGSDSHTRYGALGTMGIGEGGGELVKQLVGHTYDIALPPILGVKLSGSPRPGVGPMDVALAIIAKTFANGFNKNKILEFVGDGIGSLSMEFRMGIDVMMTESAALSSVWCTDEKTATYLQEHGRAADYTRMAPAAGVYYDGLIEVDMSTVESMIALPFHPSHAMPIRAFLADAESILRDIEAKGNEIKGEHGEPFRIMQHLKDGDFYPDQALVSGCAGGMFENIVAVADILKDENGEMLPINGAALNLHVNPASLPIMEDLMQQGVASELALAGITLRPCICGPCFGVTDTPANNQLSIRHVTRNYPNREGSKPGQGQMAAVCLMDARSIAATVRNGGKLTAADSLDVQYRTLQHHFNEKIYQGQVYQGYGKADPGVELVKGPNIADWPEMAGLKQHLLLEVSGSYEGSVTTDELIPSGEASSYRSNPEKISGFTMISRDPNYVGRAKKIRAIEAGPNLSSKGNITFGSLMVADAIGDGSSREQAASCQKVLGGFANLSNEYSTKRYRSNLINWGLLPLRTDEKLSLPVGSYLFIENAREVLESGAEALELKVLSGIHVDSAEELAALNIETLRQHISGSIACTLDRLTNEEREILLAGSLINLYKS